MIIAIDIGNTTTTFGTFDAGRLKAVFAIMTKAKPTHRTILRRLKRLPGRDLRRLKKASEIIICSVVPRMSSALERALRFFVSAPILLLDRDITIPLKNRYRRPRQVGQDRLAGAFAAWKRYGSACIVVDIGTAITIDVVTGRGEYLGGVIVPGLEMSLEALYAKTALLPKVKLTYTARLLGRDTVESIRSGLLYGYPALCDGVVRDLRRRYAPRAAVVVTGGHAHAIARRMEISAEIDPHLVLRGLAQLVLSNRR